MRKELLQLLGELATLSENHGYSWHDDYVRQTIAAFEKNPNDGWQHLLSAHFWGGAGSICDVPFSADEPKWHRENGRTPPKYLNTLDEDGYRRDNTRYMELLSAISDAIPNKYESDEQFARWFERAKRIGAIYDTWLADPKNAKIMRL